MNCIGCGADSVTVDINVENEVTKPNGEFYSFTAPPQTIKSTATS